MNTYQRYQQARDAAWKTLIACGVSALPVNAKELAAKLSVEVLPWPEEADDHFRLLEMAGGGDCRSLRIRGKWHIFLKEGKRDDQHVHFAIAHELAHIVLRHDLMPVIPGVRTFRSRENEGDAMEDPLDLADYVADIFAIRLLAPACVLHGLECCIQEDMIRICGLPPKAAALRAERMGLLRERNAFLSHPLERRVYSQFLPFIQQFNSSIPPCPEMEASCTPPPSEKKKRLGRWMIPGAAIGALIAILVLIGIFK